MKVKKIIPIISGAIMMALTACSSSGSGTAAATVAAPETRTAPDFNADSAYSYVARQVAFGPRVPGTATHAACAAYLADELRRHGADTVMVQTGSMKGADGTVLVKNIMARFNSKAPRRVLLLAHYDTRPWADADPDESKHNTPIPGANDGGSGTGVLLELARMFGAKHPDVGVDILLTDAEDSGRESDAANNNEDSWCLGTQYWAEHLPYASASERPVYGILLDMVGGRDARFYREYVSERMARSVNDRVWATAARSPYASRFVNEIHGSLVDDHLFVARAGIPCIDIVECNNPATGSFPPQWHTMADDMDAIDASTLKAVGQVVADVVYSERAD